VAVEQLVEADAWRPVHRFAEEHHVTPRHRRVELVRYAERNRELPQVMNVTRERILQWQSAEVAPRYIKMLPMVEGRRIEGRLLECLHEPLGQ
jgi:hypothetical protein